MRTRFVVLLVGVMAALLVASSATAKEFNPGDLRICNHHRCAAVTSRPVLKLLIAFYYSGRSEPAQARAPHLGARAFELRFKNGYATGIVATGKLDRFLSYGVNLGRFGSGR